MEGFGSADVTTPFHYGSVQESMGRGETLEHKLRKKYWKTKQTVLQKLGKDQDEFVVAGDSGIDTKLEKAYHLKSSCHDLLLALDRYCSKLRAVTTQEEVMGEHLCMWSETEYTNAGEVMQNVGKLQRDDSKARLSMLPSLLRMQSEFLVFQDSAIKDLHHSIELLEKSRTEYRAALLWMKDVSEKLHNPDYRDQLTRFREAQAAVKEAKSRFEKLKHDLSEKIDMVSASRCNLLSRALPTYQNELLKFSDNMANQFHKILVDLRSHHHHQYKVRRLFEEIRDLESDETAVAEERCFSEMLSPSSPVDSKANDKRDNDDDDQLLDIGSSMSAPENEGEMLNTLDDLQHEARINDLVLGGTNAGLAQKDSVSPTSDEQQPEQTLAEEAVATDGAEESVGDFGDLLQLDSDTKTHGTEDILSSEWNKFSAFMPETKIDPQSPTAGWENDFLKPSSDGLDLLGSTTPSSEPTASVATSTALDTSSGSAPSQTSVQAPSVKKSSDDVNELLGLADAKEKEGSQASAVDTNSLLFEDLQSLGITPTDTSQSTPAPAVPQSNDLDLSTLDAAYFQRYTLTQSQQPSPASHQPPMLAGGIPTFRSPLPSSTGPIIPRQLSSPAGLKNPKTAAENDPSSKKPVGRGRTGEGQDKKGTSWMNVFQHLDPLVNEKA